MNPAFARFDRITETLYFCTESIEENGQIVAYAIDSQGRMIPKSMQNAHGTSTCYLTLDNVAGNCYLSTTGTLLLALFL